MNIARKGALILASAVAFGYGAPSFTTAADQIDLQTTVFSQPDAVVKAGANALAALAGGTLLLTVLQGKKKRKTIEL